MVTSRYPGTVQGCPWCLAIMFLALLAPAFSADPGA
jgi:hypothetical protein